MDYFPVGDHKAQYTDAHKGITNTRQKKKHLISTKEVQIWNGRRNILPKGLNQFHGTNLAFNSDVDQVTFGKATKHNKHDSQEVSPFQAGDYNATKNRLESFEFDSKTLTLLQFIHDCPQPFPNLYFMFPYKPSFYTWKGNTCKLQQCLTTFFKCLLLRHKAGQLDCDP